MTKVRTILEMGLREYARTPVLIALLLLLPAYIIVVFSWAVPSQPISIEVPGNQAIRFETTAVIAVMMTPVIAALIGGIAGLFLMQSAREVDTRLLTIGVSVHEIIVARTGVLILAATIASIVSIVVMLFTYIPKHIVAFFVATILIGIMYGGIGAFIGLFVSRLAGVYIIMFAPLMDLFLAQSPFAEQTPTIGVYLPGYYPMQLAFDAAFSPDIAIENLIGSIGYLLVIGVFVGASFYRRLRVNQT
ncbi:MAG: hypothetical protein ABEI06_03615 [Halobacteriaceae archaeon]